MYSVKCNVLNILTKKLHVKDVFLLSKDDLERFVLDRRKKKVLLPSKKMYQEFSITKKKVLQNDCYKIRPKEKCSKKKVLFIHGGGYCLEADSREWWRGNFEKKDYRVSPRYGDITGLAPMTIFSSKTEVLNLFVQLFLKDAKKQGVEVEYHEKRDMIHCWVLTPLKESYEERERIMELIRGAI